MTLADHSVSSLLDAFSSPTPTPGGGSASALSAAVGASLLIMVAELTRARAADDEVKSALETCAGVLRERRASLLGFIDRDTAAYDAVMAAYRLPKATEADTMARKADVQRALIEATETPLDIMRAVVQALTEGLVVARHGRTAARSDVGVGLELLQAGLRGAALNVRINLDSVADPPYVARARETAARLEAEAATLAEAARSKLAAR